MDFVKPNGAVEVIRADIADRKAYESNSSEDCLNLRQDALNSAV
jgi:hypothetical protein